MERFDPQVDLAKLARAAGLLLVPAVSFSGPCDRLAIGNARGVSLDAHAVALAHSFEQHTDVELPHTVQDSLVDTRVVLNANTRILGCQLVERVRETLLVSPPLRLDGNPQHGRRKAHGLEMIFILFVRIVDDGIEMELFDLGCDADVSRNGCGDLCGVLPHDFVQMGDLHGLAAVADKHEGARTQRALVDAQKT